MTNALFSKCTNLFCSGHALCKGPLTEREGSVQFISSLR